MAELESGAAEYDRLMASGEAPAKKAKVIPLRNRWYAVAACFIGLLIVGGAYMLNTGSEPQIAEVKQTVTPKQVESQIAHAIDNKIRSTSFVEAHDAPKRKTLPKVAKEEEDYDSLKHRADYQVLLRVLVVLAGKSPLHHSIYSTRKFSLDNRLWEFLLLCKTDSCQQTQQHSDYISSHSCTFLIKGLNIIKIDLITKYHDISITSFYHSIRKKSYTCHIK